MLKLRRTFRVGIAAIGIFAPSALHSRPQVKSEVPQTCAAITQEDLNRAGAGSVAEMLRTLPNDCAAPQNLSPFARDVLNAHNALRREVGAPALRWDEELARHAQARAEELARIGQLAHAPREGRGTERENLSQGLRGWSAIQMMNNWFKEKRLFHAGKFPDVCDGDWSTCAHYSQAIWEATTAIGCGMASSVGFQWMVCRYNPGGNKDGKWVGTPVSIATADSQKPTRLPGSDYGQVTEFRVVEGVDIGGILVAFPEVDAALFSAPIGTYPQIFADTVTLNGGTLVANISAPNGLYETTFYNNVIDGLTGEFDQCIATGIPANSLLLSFGCIYDGLDNVDLSLIRTPFNLVPGLNRNGEQVGEGLECIYNVNLTGGLAQMFADLFLFTNAVNYNTALNMLSGSVYANYLNSFPSFGTAADGDTAVLVHDDAEEVGETKPAPAGEYIPPTIDLVPDFSSPPPEPDQCLM